MAEVSFYGTQFTILPKDVAVFEKAIGCSLVQYAEDLGWKMEEGDAAQGLWFGECNDHAWEDAVEFLKKIGPHLSGPHSFDWQDENGEEGRFLIRGGKHEVRSFDKVTVDWEDPNDMRFLLQKLVRALTEKSGADSVRQAVDEAIVAPVMEE